jgi:hypothetical protein
MHGIVDFKYIENLNKLQDKFSLKIANRISNGHIFFQNIKMKVREAVQLISKCVEDALRFCRDMG